MGCLNWRWGPPLALFCLFITLNSVMLFYSQLLYNENMNYASRRSLSQVNLIHNDANGKYDPYTRDWTDNIAGQSYYDSLCAQPIDIVYTWVNGSDPKQIEDVRKCNETETEADGCYKDEETANRFQDNEELRYSLRSVWKFAPWVRNIYLVTNGQIPAWLNIHHPRIHLVTHESIFLNKSHLPTFSSPAIECHLHRIPGLSEHFLYLNDDTMFGNHIHPSDFYTVGRGQRVYLSWPVPDCAQGCPSNWIGDGYCDAACNVSACDFDGGDCANATSATRQGFNWWFQNQPSSGFQFGTQFDKYCSPGCPDTWIGDKYCDRSCRTPECAMDGGDCGIDVVYQNVAGFRLDADNQTIEFPYLSPLDQKPLAALYINLTSVIPQDEEISEASYAKSPLIRTAIISQKNKAIIVALNKNESAATVSVSLTVKGKDGAERRVFFNIAGSTADKGQSESEKQTDTNSDENDGDRSASRHGRQLQSIDEDLTEDSDEEDTTGGWKKMSLSDSGIELLREASKSGRDYREEDVYPWEIPELLKQREELMRQKQLEESTNSMSRATSRKLLDNYGESLKYVNKLLNAEFGNAARRVPAHMPHYIQKPIIEKMHKRWPEHFERTSSHRLRAPDDMQFAFSYFYYMMHERKEYNLTTLFYEELDTSGDGRLDKNELRTLVVSLLDKQFHKEQVDYLLEEAANCTNNGTLDFTLEVLQNCTKLLAKVEKHYKNRLLNKFEIADSDEVAFVMVRTNATNTLHAIDGIRQTRQKFICLNDNLNHSDPHSVEVVKILQEFYESLFPHPSPFELPPGTTNKYLYVSELLEVREQIRKKKQFVYAMLFAVMVCLIILVRACASSQRARKQSSTIANSSTKEKRFIKMLSV